MRLFVVDSIEETQKVAAAAPGSAVLCRIVTSGEGSDWSLSRKYGCSAEQAVAPAPVGRRRRPRPGRGLVPRRVAAARHRGLGRPDRRLGPGLRRRSAPTGSSRGCSTWAAASPPTSRAAACRWRPTAPPSSASLRRHFGGRRPQTIVEPGRGVVADAGTLVSTVLAVVRRGDTRWVFLDAGVFTGLVETLDESIRYRVDTSADGGPTGPCVLAGPTCDSVDVLYERVPVDLPLALGEDDTVRLHSTGAYTTCYSTVGFNGFAPLPTRHV